MRGVASSYAIDDYVFTYTKFVKISYASWYVVYKKKAFLKEKET